MKKITYILAVIVLICCIASLTACSTAKQYFVYGTTLEVSASGIKASQSVRDVYQYISSLEGVLSPTVEGSDLHKINHANVGEPIACQNVTMDIMRVAKLVYEKSHGAYDPSIYPLVRLWKFSGDTFVAGTQGTLPSDDEILHAQSLIGLDKAFDIDFDNSTITKRIDGAMLDFGSVAKGYATQKSLEIATSKTLVNLGGNIGASGKEYSVGIANPQRIDRQFSTAYFAKFTLFDGECVSTSGDYERYYSVVANDVEKIVHHIINPFTAQPVDTSADGAVISCTVVTKDGALGDAIATAVVVLGVQEGAKLCEELGVKAFIIASDMSVTTVGDFQYEIKK